MRLLDYLEGYMGNADAVRVSAYLDRMIRAAVRAEREACAIEAERAPETAPHLCEATRASIALRIRARNS